MENNDIYWESNIPLCNIHIHTRMHMCTQKLINALIPRCMLCILEWNSSSSLFSTASFGVFVCVCVTGIKLLLPWKLIECLCVTCGTWCAAMAESFLGSGMQRRLWCASFLSCVLRIPKKINPSVIAANLRVLESNLIIMREYQQLGLLFFFFFLTDGLGFYCITKTTLSLLPERRAK